jgi:signal peptidase I
MVEIGRPPHQSEPEPDPALVARAKAGDEGAFTALYERFLPSLYDFVFRILRNPTATEDVVQVSFLHAWERRADLRDPGKLRSWLFALAHNTAIDHLRRSRPVDNLEDSPELASLGPGPADEAERNEAGELVWAAAASLEPRQYAVLDLNVRRGFSTAEIADVVGVTDAHAAVLVHRARDALGNAVRYLLVARRRDTCPGLAALVPSGVTALSPEQRTSVDHHIRRCEVCKATGRLVTSPAELFGAVTLVAVPATLRSTIARGPRSLPHGTTSPSPSGHTPGITAAARVTSGLSIKAAATVAAIAVAISGGVLLPVLHPWVSSHAGPGPSQGPFLPCQGPVQLGTPITGANVNGVLHVGMKAVLSASSTSQFSGSNVQVRPVVSGCPQPGMALVSIVSGPTMGTCPLWPGEVPTGQDALPSPPSGSAHYCGAPDGFGSVVRVDGQSMSPTLRDQQILVGRGVGPKGPQRGDIVVFAPPNQPAPLLLKRVIGLPGDTIEIDGSNAPTRVLVQPAGQGPQQLLQEPYLPEPWTSEDNCCRSDGTVSDTAQPVVVPPGTYFVMGDNRNFSSDSRNFGFVPAAQIYDVIVGPLGADGLFTQAAWPLPTLVAP